jgi:hypothetical protein
MKQMQLIKGQTGPVLKEGGDFDDRAQAQGYLGAERSEKRGSRRGERSDRIVNDDIEEEATCFDVAQLGHSMT